MEADRVGWGHLTSHPMAPGPLPSPWARDSLHALGSLPGHINKLDHVKACVGNMQVVVETGTFTPLCNNGKSWPGHEAHEQQDVDMSSFPAGREGQCQGRGWRKQARSDCQKCWTLFTATFSHQFHPVIQKTQARLCG